MAERFWCLWHFGHPACFFPFPRIARIACSFTGLDGQGASVTRLHSVQTQAGVSKHMASRKLTGASVAAFMLVLAHSILGQQNSPFTRADVCRDIRRAVSKVLPLSEGDLLLKLAEALSVCADVDPYAAIDGSAFRAKALLKLKRFSDALTEGQACVAIDANSPRCHMAIADAYWGLGARKEILKPVAEAERLYSGQVQAAEILLRDSSLSGDARTRIEGALLEGKFGAAGAALMRMRTEAELVP